MVPVAQEHRVSIVNLEDLNPQMQGKEVCKIYSYQE